MTLTLEDPLYEVVDGKRVESPRIGAHESMIASALIVALGSFNESHFLGVAVGETLFDLGPVRRQRRPEVAFVSFQRWPDPRLAPCDESAWNVIPNLAVEVVSRTNTADEIHTKVHEYLDAGVELVWIVYPVPGEVYVYESPVKVHVVTRTGVLDGGKVLPGFELPLAELFGEEPRIDAANGSPSSHRPD